MSWLLIGAGIVWNLSLALTSTAEEWPNDPPSREDGLCARNGCGRRVERGKMVQKYAGHHIVVEPFCSTACCRAYHGIAAMPTERELRNARSGQINADRYRASRAEKARY